MSNKMTEKKLAKLEALVPNMRRISLDCKFLRFTKVDEIRYINAIPELIAEVRTLQARVDKVERERDMLADRMGCIPSETGDHCSRCGG